MKCSNVLIMTTVVLLMGGVAFAQWTEEPDADVVYVTDPMNGAIVALYDGGQTTEYSSDNYVLEDLVIGPDLMVYVTGFWCDYGVGEGFAGAGDPLPASDRPECDDGGIERGIILRIDPGDEVVEVVHDSYIYDDDEGEWIEVLPRLPRGPWFNHHKSLVVTEGVPNPRDGVLYEFEGIAAIPPDDLLPGPTVILNTDDVGDGFSGQGITHFATGTLIFADEGQRKVWTLDYDPTTGMYDTANGVGTLPFGVVSPMGVSRLSTGQVFASAGTQLVSLEADGVGPDKQWFEYCAPIDFEDATQVDPAFPSDNCTSYPTFHEVTANDWLYLVTYDVCDDGVTYYTGSLWVVDPDNNPNNPATDCSAEFLGRANVDSLWGLAVPPTSRLIEDPEYMGQTTDVDDYTTDNYLFDFADHVYELNVPVECEPVITAVETAPACADPVLNYLFPDGEGGTEADTGLYLGEKGFLVVYELLSQLPDFGDGDYYPGDGYGFDDACQPDEDDGEYIGHALSAYFDNFSNMRLIRCESPFLDIESYYPFLSDNLCDVAIDDCAEADFVSIIPADGNLPGDGRIASRTATFSLYFTVNVPLENGGLGNGCGCGFNPPLTNSLDQFDPDLTEKHTGSTLPVKFLMGSPDENGCNCGKRDLVGDLEAQIVIARVDEFQCMLGCNESVYFPMPNNPKAGYHLNIDLDGYEEGTYVVVAFSPDLQFTAFYTYFRVFD